MNAANGPFSPENLLATIIGGVVGSLIVALVTPYLFHDPSKPAVRISRTGMVVGALSGAFLVFVYMSGMSAATRQISTPISLQPLAQSPARNPSNLGLQAGMRTLLGVPFDVGWEVTTENQRNPGYPKVIQLNVNLSKPDTVYLLIQAGWGFSKYKGLQVGVVRLRFTGDASTEVPLVLGENIRDWSQDHTDAVTTFQEGMLKEAWRGTTPSGDAGHIDMLEVAVPDAYKDSALRAIELVDTSSTTTGSVDPAIHLLAVTVRHAPSP